MEAGTTVQITMPQMGDSVTEGTVLEWLKQVGDPVEPNETLRVHELSGGGEHRVVDIKPHHLAVGPDPLAQQSEPPDRTTSDVESAGAATFADLVEKPAPSVPTPATGVAAARARRADPPAGTPERAFPRSP